MTIAPENNPFAVSFLMNAAPSVGNLWSDVYIAGSMTVAVCNTDTNVKVGYIRGITKEASSTQVNVAMYYPLCKGIARGAITAGDAIAAATGTSGFVEVGGTNTGLEIAIAVTGALSAGQLFSYVPARIGVTTLTQEGGHNHGRIWTTSTY